MKNLNDLLYRQINDNLIHVIISGRRNKQEELKKIKIRPVEIKDRLFFQATEYIENKVVHKNYEAEEIITYILNHLQTDFKQCQLETTTEIYSVLVSKKGHTSISVKKRGAKLAKTVKNHNREKNYLIKPQDKAPFLMDLGIVTADGKIANSKYDKFKQINRFLEFIQDVLPILDKDREISIIDFGCGKSYLTFAMYYFLHDVKGYDIKVTGLDLKRDVIAKCNELSRKYGYDKLSFELGNIADYDKTSSADMVVTLHACDTATDYAIEKAVKWDAKVILSVPCCQHELNRQIENELLRPVLKYGILKERFSAILTDAIRAEILEEYGYETQILEFIDMEHTPKNLLIRAVKKSDEKISNNELSRLIHEFDVTPTLRKLLK